MIYKRLSSILFALAFISAIGVFTNYFQPYVSRWLAKSLVLVFGAVALLVNVLAFRSEEGKNSGYNIVFWIGAILVFGGLVMKLFNYPYFIFPIIPGLLIAGVSFFYNPFAKREKRDDLLDL